MRASTRLVAPSALVACALVACGAAPTESSASTSQADSTCVTAPASRFWVYDQTLEVGDPAAVWFLETDVAPYVNGKTTWLPFVAIDTVTAEVVATEWVPQGWSDCFSALFEVCQTPDWNGTGGQSGKNDIDPPRCPIPNPVGPDICVSSSFAASAQGPLWCTVTASAPPVCAGQGEPDGGVPVIPVLHGIGIGSGGGAGNPPSPPKGPILTQ